ncbi:hypothetical protein BC834DRAFT_906190 [Gloeopeniophorella convolvens]|nr:hypothetical protein BC834DRAFT_906190 [Gloeopeniophorella convolvens]
MRRKRTRRRDERRSAGTRRVPYEKGKSKENSRVVRRAVTSCTSGSSTGSMGSACASTMHAETPLRAMLVGAMRSKVALALALCRMSRGLACGGCTRQSQRSSPPRSGTRAGGGSQMRRCCDVVYRRIRAVQNRIPIGSELLVKDIRVVRAASVSSRRRTRRG